MVGVSIREYYTILGLLCALKLKRRRLEIFSYIRPIGLPNFVWGLGIIGLKGLPCISLLKPRWRGWKEGDSIIHPSQEYIDRIIV